MGVKEGDLDPNFMTLAEEFDSVMTSRLTSPWKIVTPLYAVSKEGSKLMGAINFGRTEVRRIIRKRIKLSQIENDDEIQTPTVIDALIEEHNLDPVRMPIEDIIDEVMNFLLAGWDTTTWTLSLLLQLIGNHPDVQERMYQEIMDTVNADSMIAACGQNETDGAMSDSDSTDAHVEITMKELKKLKYTECVMNETLRLYPLVNLHGRRLVKKLPVDIDGNEVIFPAWTEVVIDSELVHRSSKYWPDADRFHPERFASPEDIDSWEREGGGPLFKDQKKIEPFSFIPFSAGPRNCIGRAYGVIEVKILLCHLLAHYKITSILPMDKIKFNYVGTVRRTDDPIQFMFEKRNSCPDLNNN